MDQQQQQNVNQAAQEWTEAVRQSFQTLADRTVNLQESNLKLTQNFFQQFVEQLQSQTQGIQQVTQTLQQQAFEALAQESAKTYSDFLGSALSFYQQTMSQATQGAWVNMQAAEQVAQQGVQAASQAAQSSMQAAQQTMQGVQQAAPVSGRAPRRVIASAADWEDVSPIPISGPAARVDDEPTPSKYTPPDHEAAMQLINELLSEDPSYDEETWPEIAEALDRDRPSYRKLFVD